VSGTIKKVGLLFGTEDAFPWALFDAIAAVGQGEVVADLVKISALRDTQEFDCALILDRIGHEVPFYRAPSHPGV
jgi:hypothetical protein